MDSYIKSIVAIQKSVTQIVPKLLTAIDPQAVRLTEVQ